MKLGDLIRVVPTRGHQIFEREIRECGRFPVVSQSDNDVEGFSDADIAVKDVPLILFGDHTCCLKYIETPFVVGADGTKLFKIEKVDQRFAYYYLRLMMPNVSDGKYRRHFSSLRELDVSSMALVEDQESVARVLSTIDRKIALNRKRIATLETMAKEIYDYWFVQFDFPDANGRPYKSSGGAMVYNPDLKREIPKGWEVGCLADIAQYPKETVRSDAIDIKHYVTTDSLLQGKKGRVQAVNLPPVPVSLVAFQKGDTLVANIRPYLKKLWYASESGGCSQDVLVFHPICSELAPLLHSILWQDAFFDYVMAAAKGSKMPRGDKAHILAYPISLPDNKVARRFGETVEKFYAWRECALKESESLSSLRDFLLPLLMNGQVKVA